VDDDNDDATPSSEAQLVDLESLVSEGLVTALVRQIQSQYGWLGSAEVEDVVAGAIEQVVRRVKKAPLSGDLAAYVFKAALYRAKNTARQVARRAERPLDDLPASTSPPVDEEVLRRRVVELLVAEIRSWENAHIREVTLIDLEAAVAGEPLDDAEVADLVSQVLGEEINPRSVSQWRRRGLQKLTKFAEQLGGTDEPPGRDQDA
jgi:DNA-directed RNA polymerase specialized sigma24 family protein